MTAYKIGVGSAYASITGFTWPDGLNPFTQSVPIQKRISGTDVLFKSININLAAGNQDTFIGISGKFFSFSDYQNLRKIIGKNSLDANGEIINNYLKFYMTGTTFYWVMGSGLSDTQNSDLYGVYPYSGNLKMIHPYEYADTIKTYTVTTTNTSAAIANIDNNGSAEVYPYFEIINTTGASITAVSITDGTRILTWSGTIASGKSLRIIQEQNPDLSTEDYWAAFLFDNTSLTGTPTLSGISGQFIFLDGSVQDTTITATLTGNNNSATFNVKFREREV
jgi:hypothetical protein